MDYQAHYNRLIINAACAPREKGGDVYYEEHHALPKATHPEFEKDRDNLVLLTAREHFIAHWLLHKSNPECRKMATAFWQMCIAPDSTIERSGKLYRPTSIGYEAGKKAHSEAISGERNPIHEYLSDPENKRVLGQKISEAFAKNWADPEWRAAYQKKKSDLSLARSEQLSKTMSETNKRVWSNITEEEKARRVSHMLTPEAKAARNESFRLHMQSLSDEERRERAAHFRGVPKKRTVCDKCGSEVTVNTLATHQRSFGCANYQFLSTAAENGHTVSSLLEVFDIDRRELNRALKRVGITDIPPGERKKLAPVKGEAIRTPHGDFISVREASRETSISRTVLKKLLRTNPEEWYYHEENK